MKGIESDVVECAVDGDAQEPVAEGERGVQRIGGRATRPDAGCSDLRVRGQ